MDTSDKAKHSKRQYCAKRHQRIAGFGADGSRGYRTLAFFGVQTVCLYVMQVIEAIDGTGDQAE